jgi:hypothetical protein
MRLGKFVVPSALFAALLSFAGAQAQSPTPHWGFGRFVPPGNVLPRDQNRPPAVLGFFFKMTPPDGWTVTWTAKVTASAQLLTQEIGHPSQGERHLFFRLDPCKVTGLDTPGTEIPVTYEFVFSATQPNGSWNPPSARGSFILKLDRDTVPPMINTLNAPSTAYRDQTIQVTISATDVSDEIGDKPVWDSGLRTFTLEGPTNPGASGAPRRQTEPIDETFPQTCNEKVKKERHVFSYTIPHSAQPGDEIKLHAEAVDWSGNMGTQDTVVKIVDPPKPNTPFPPRAGCKQISGSPTFYQGIGGNCSGELQICGEIFRWECNAKSFSRPMSIMERVPGPDVCCDDWKKARQAKKPCDIGNDADCDGIRNSEDKAPANQNAR